MNNVRFSRAIRIVGQLASICSLTLILSGCQIFTQKHGRAASDFGSATEFGTLEGFGNDGGFLIVALVAERGFPQVPRVQEIVVPSGQTEASVTLGTLVRRTGLLGARVNPAMEFGAIYYLPAKYNADERKGRVIQKLCGTVDGHQVDELIIRDEPSGIKNQRRKLILNGSVDADLFGTLTGLNASAGADYLVEIEVRDSRIRYIDTPDAKFVMNKLLAGEKCRTEFLPQARDREKFQLVSAYYGSIVIKQAYELRGNVGAPRLKAELEFGRETDETRFVFFKLFSSEVD